jgi:phage gp29-like protein
MALFKSKAITGKELARMDSYEYTDFDKVVQKKGLEVYREMKYDDQVKFCLLLKKFLILAAGWEIDGTNEEQVNFVRDSFKKLDRSFSTILFEMLTAIDYGFSVSELIWEKEKNAIPSRVLLKNIKAKFPWDVEFNYDDYGNLLEEEGLMISSEPMPLDKFVIYSFMEEFGNKLGESDLKGVYSAVWFKKIVWKFWARHLERFGSPIVKGHVPTGTSEQESTKFKAMITRLHNIVGLVLPRNKGGEEFDFELVETKREGGGQFLEAIENADNRIGRGLLIPTLFGASKQQFGSYALGVEQFKVVYKFLSFLGANFAEEAINRQVVKRMIDYNFVTPEYPVFRFKPLDVELVKDFVEMNDEHFNKIESGDKEGTLFTFTGTDLERCPICNAGFASKGTKYYVCTNGHTFEKKRKGGKT